MNTDIKTACADLILTDAIEDMARADNIGIDIVRENILSSKAYDALYDFDTDLWQAGPDYFISFYRSL